MVTVVYLLGSSGKIKLFQAPPRRAKGYGRPKFYTFWIVLISESGELICKSVKCPSLNSFIGVAVVYSSVESNVSQFYANYKSDDCFLYFTMCNILHIYMRQVVDMVKSKVIVSGVRRF